MQLKIGRALWSSKAHSKATGRFEKGIQDFLYSKRKKKSPSFSGTTSQLKLRTAACFINDETFESTANLVLRKLVLLS